MRSSSANAESGSHVEARTILKDVLQRSSAISIAAEPEPLLPYKVYNYELLTDELMTLPPTPQ